MFRFFVNLESLDLLQDSHSYIFPLLQHVSPSHPVLLPALHTLHFSHAYFRPDSVSWGKVLAFLRWRREQGYPVHRVSILEGQIDREFVLHEHGDEDVEVDIDPWNNSDPDSELDPDDDYLYDLTLTLKIIESVPFDLSE